MTTPSSPESPSGSAASLKDLPHDELVRYGRELGLELGDNLTSDEVAQRVVARRRLLEAVDRDGMLDVIKWARRPVRSQATKEDLVREIARIDQTNYDAVSRRGLVALAQLRDMPVSEADNTEDLIARLRKQEGFWKKLHRKRRAVIGSLLAKALDAETEAAREYQFLPDDEGDTDSNKNSLQRQIEDHGLVGGLANQLRGAADDYIENKLDEIESRIDSKLNEIDQRLAEWRDREVANRLKILRVTLAFTILVAVLSLGYNYIKNQAAAEQAQESRQVTDPPSD